MGHPQALSTRRIFPSVTIVVQPRSNSGGHHWCEEPHCSADEVQQGHKELLSQAASSSRSATCPDRLSATAGGGQARAHDVCGTSLRAKRQRQRHDSPPHARPHARTHARKYTMYTHSTGSN
ncbi:hypothetical protein GN956_G13104 [Arapaima gigas]